MSGTKEGAQKAGKTNKQRHGKDFYARIGAMGGEKSRGGGFTSETAALYGKLGSINRVLNFSLSEDERLQYMHDREVVLKKIEALNKEEREQ